MRLKNFIVIAVIIPLFAFSEKTFAQNWKYWPTVDGVLIYYSFTPAQGNTHPYYQVRLVNSNKGTKIIYANFYFERKDKKLSMMQFSYNDNKWIVRLKFDDETKS